MPHFAAKWLMRRIDDFRSSGLTSSSASTSSYEVRDFDVDDVDVAIRFGAGKYPGLHADRLFDNVVIPVCSPRLLKSGPPLAGAARSVPPHARPYRMVAPGRDLAELAHVDGGSRRRRFRRQPDPGFRHLDRRRAGRDRRQRGGARRFRHGGQRSLRGPAGAAVRARHQGVARNSPISWSIPRARPTIPASSPSATGLLRTRQRRRSQR